MTRQAPAGHLDVRYRPVLGAGAEWIDTFRCLPVLAGPGGDVLSGNAVLAHRGNIEATAKKNAQVLKPAFNSLVRAVAGGQDIHLVVPVNSVALASKQGATVLIDLMKDLPAAVRGRVIVEVFNFPASVTLDVLETITIPMLIVFERFIAAPRRDLDDFTVFANCNYEGVSLDLAEVRDGGGDARKALTGFWSLAAPRRLGLYVQGVDEAETLAAAERYEAGGIEGSAVGAADGQLGPAGPVSSFRGA